MKQHTGHVIPPTSITHLGPGTHIFNGSEHQVYVEVMESGELVVQPLPSGQVIIWFGEEGS